MKQCEQALYLRWKCKIFLNQNLTLNARDKTGIINLLTSTHWFRTVFAFIFPYSFHSPIISNLMYSIVYMWCSLSMSILINAINRRCIFSYRLCPERCKPGLEIRYSRPANAAGTSNPLLLHGFGGRCPHLFHRMNIAFFQSFIVIVI